MLEAAELRGTNESTNEAAEENSSCNSAGWYIMKTICLITELEENPGPLLLASFGGYSVLNRLLQSDGSISV
ncbi:unnamed protein product [Bubo scandiacus]